MKIGIITFHWATNYGAILQAYALQTFLEGKGHQVEIINYKPLSHEISFRNLIKDPRNLFHIKKFYQKKRKESLLVPFREQYLHQTKRFSNQESLKELSSRYDVIISGSDQVLNPSFTLYGESKRPSSAYYLSFASPGTRKVGYAVSFGCNTYPSNAARYAKEWIKWFDYISVRESSGVDIVGELGFGKPAVLVPDPVVLCGKRVFAEMTLPPVGSEQYICVYSLRQELSLPEGFKYRVLDDIHSPVSIEEWVAAIAGADALITNSFHGMVVALLNHIPFAINIVGGREKGMNDRFYTLLEKVGLTNRICGEKCSITELLNDRNIDWDKVDNALGEVQDEGIAYLKTVLSQI